MAEPTPEPMTAERLAEISAREQKATEGPWWAWDRGVGFHIAVGDEVDSFDRPGDYLPAGSRTDIGRREDADFIAHARQDVPALLAEVERLTNALAANTMPPTPHEPGIGKTSVRVT